MNNEHTRRFYEAKIRRDFRELDSAIDDNRTPQVIEYIEEKIWVWEELYKSLYGRYFMVDQREREVQKI